MTFRWQPAGPLPAGAAYEVVGWNAGEDPASARGIAAPTQDTTLTADLDALYNSGLFKGTDLYWAVIIVQTQPYVRLTQPAQSSPQLLIYVPPSGGGAARHHRHQNLRRPSQGEDVAYAGSSEWCNADQKK